MRVDIENAPKDGRSVILRTHKRVLQASWHGGRWREEKEWLKHELSRPEPIITPIEWEYL